MSYAAIDTAAKATRSAGDLLGRIEVAFVKKAIVRAGAIGGNDDGRERGVIAAVMDGGYPDSWKLTVLGLLDIAGQLASPTDAQIDTQVDTAWLRFTQSRI